MSAPRSAPPALTPEQRAALADSGSSIALSAGAGCGKTFVLTERFLRHLDGDGLEACSLARLIALTFTDKAARELRERVRRACRRRLAAEDDPEPRKWRTILRGLEAAPIGTFHAFCGELLRRFPIEAGVEPGFAIAEESIAPRLRAEALSDCIRAWLAEGDPDLFAVAVELGLPRVRDYLARLLLLRTRGPFDAWAGRDPEAIIAAWRHAWTTRALPALVARFRDQVRPCLDRLAVDDCAHPAMRARVAYLLEAVPALADHPDPQAHARAIRERAMVKGVTKKHWPSEESYAATKDALDRLRREADKVLKAEWDEDATRQAAALAARLARLAARAEAACDHARRDHGLLDFDDLLLRARRLLADLPESVRSWLEQAVGFVLIDEFQDTDPIQGEIVRTLAGAGLRTGRLFLVGDSKQSIYRFRGARPEVFDEFRRDFPEPGRLQITENFRSRPEILDFVNALFADAFPGQKHLLRPGPGMPEPDGRAAVEFLWAHEPAGEGAGARAKVSVDERRRIEARWIARHLARRIGEGWPIRDRETKEVRNAHAGDVVLLFRSLNDAAAYESALVHEGLDYHVVGGAAFYGQQEVLDLINLLSAIEDPFDSLALAAILRSPFGCVSDEGLYWLATSAHGDLALGLEHWARIPGLSLSDRARAGRLHRLMARWRALKDRGPIAALVERAIDESGYEAALLGEFLGERRRANVRKLVRLARRYDAQGGLTLADFVARLRADYRDPPREDEAATTDEAGEAVRLMTIHQAKGLEFPIVVVPDLNRDAPSSRSPITFHPDLGPILKPPEDDSTVESKPAGASLGRLVLQHLERQEEEAEARCVFYVAVTRARDALILSAGMAPDEAPRSPALALLDERFDRATGACRATLPAGCRVPLVRVIATEPPPRESAQAHTRRVARLHQVARLIVSAQPAETAPTEPRRLARPRFLDLDPALALPPHSAGVDRLIRAILEEPEALDPRTLPALVRRLARIQTPAAPRRIERQARDLLAAWLETGSGRALARADRVVRSLSWTASWPPDDPEPTVIRGTLDFAASDSEDSWTIVSLAHPDVPEPLERLRLRLSMRAAAALGVGPVERGWLVRLGPGGQTIEERPADDAAIERVLAEVLVALTGEPNDHVPGPYSPSPEGD